MRRLKLIAVAALAGAVGACAAHPIVARDPVPPPSPTEAYDCDSTPTVLNAFWTTCDARYRERRAAIRAKG